MQNALKSTYFQKVDQENDPASELNTCSLGLCSEAGAGAEAEAGAEAGAEAEAGAFSTNAPPLLSALPPHPPHPLHLTQPTREPMVCVP